MEEETIIETFFEDYKNIFFTLKEELNSQGISKKESHEFILQFLNKIMFIYFIQEKIGDGKKWLK